MTRASEATMPSRDSARPWSSRALAQASVGPIWVGALLGLVLASAMFGMLAADGVVARVRSGEIPSISLRAPVIAMLLIGLLPAFQLHLARATRRSVDLIVRDLGATRTPGRLASEHPSRAAGLCGLAAFVLSFLFPYLDPSRVASTTWWTPANAMPFVFVGVLGWLTARLIHSIVVDAVAVSRMASSLPTIDLLEPRELAPFVQQGLRGSLLLVGIMAISSVLAVSPGRAIFGSILMSLITLASAGLALLLPLRGARERIREEKQTQLSELRVAIDSARRSVLGGASDGAELRLPGLLALESRLEAVREWPLDTSSLARFGLYVALGIGSWIGAAGVERMVDRVLG